jgi:hypothetical protein
MGFDKLLNFISKNLNFDSIEEYNIDSNIKKIITNNIMFDISFLIYQSFIEIEDEINNIIKIILSLPFNFSNNLVQEEILNIFISNHWAFLNIDYDEIFDGNNEIEIINKFISYLNNKKFNDNTILDNIVAMKIFDKIQNNIINLHNIELIKFINIIFDGIPSYSKILEQRRRRIKNYIESNYKKQQYDNYFKNLDNIYEQYNNLTFDYIKWLKNRFTIDKSFGPTSPIIFFLENFIYKNLMLKFPNIKIIINQGKHNGEADYKIFKSIYNKEYTGDICIHTIDSDLVHQVIVQQNYFNIFKNDINLSIVRYNYKNNNIQYIDANIIINNIQQCYNSIASIGITFNKNIIFDVCLLFLFFGNDHLPSSYEIGPELNLNYLLKIHYDIFNNNKSIIDIENNKIIFSFENFKLYLKKIYANNEINKTKILMTRYFKINYNLLNYLTDKLELGFLQIIQVCRKLLFDDGKINNDLDEDDIRYKLINKYENLDFPIQIEQNKKINKQEMNLQFIKLLSILDKTADEDIFCGLPLYNKIFYLTNDNYKNIYNIFLDTITENFIDKNNIIFDHKNINDFFKNDIIDLNEEKIKCHNYLKKIYQLVNTLFGNMKDYTCNNFTYYKYYEVPSLYSLINYLDNNNNINFDIEISNENVNENNYFNSIIHYIIITPHIKLILWKYNQNQTLIESLNLEYLWYDNQDNFKFKDLDIYEFINKWNKLSIDSNIQKINEIGLINNSFNLIKYNN